MKMKKVPAFLLVAAVILSAFTACSQPSEKIKETSTDMPVISTEAANTSTQSEAPVFLLEELPDIGDYVPDTVYSRRYPEKRETLTPGEDYGTLIPFVGSFRNYNYVDYETGEWEDDTYSVRKIGLMNTQGEIIVDAVYDYYNIFAVNDGDYIIQLVKSGEEYDTVGDCMICSSDGSWVINKTNCDVYRPYGYENSERLLLTDYSEVDWETGTGSPKLMVYDTSGNLLFEKENCTPAYYGGYSEGYLVVSVYSDYNNFESVLRFIDAEGNIAFENVSPQSSFVNGIAIAKEGEENYGLYSIDGDWVYEPIFDLIYQRGDYYIGSLMNSYCIIDKNGKLINTVSKSKVEDRSIEFCGDKMYYEYSDYSGSERFSRYTNAQTDELITCKEIDYPVRDHIYETNYFYCADDTHTYTYIVDFDGNTVAKLEGYGSITKINDDYFYFAKGRDSDAQREIEVYSFRDFKKLWSGTEKNSGDRVRFWMYEAYAVKVYTPEEEYDEFDPNRTYDILSLESGETLAKNAKDFSVTEINGKCYINYTDGTYSYVLDPEMNVLMKTPNEYND